MRAQEFVDYHIRRHLLGRCCYCGVRLTWETQHALDCYLLRTHDSPTGGRRHRRQEGAEAVPAEVASPEGGKVP